MSILNAVPPLRRGRQGLSHCGVRLAWHKGDNLIHDTIARLSLSNPIRLLSRPFCGMCAVVGRVAPHSPRAFLRVLPEKAVCEIQILLAAWAQKLPRSQPPVGPWSVYCRGSILFFNKEDTLLRLCFIWRKAAKRAGRYMSAICRAQLTSSSWKARLLGYSCCSSRIRSAQTSLPTCSAKPVSISQISW